MAVVNNGLAKVKQQQDKVQILRYKIIEEETEDDIRRVPAIS